LKEGLGQVIRQPLGGRGGPGEGRELPVLCQEGVKPLVGKFVPRGRAGRAHPRLPRIRLCPDGPPMAHAAPPKHKAPGLAAQTPGAVTTGPISVHPIHRASCLGRSLGRPMSNRSMCSR
jgi:hypothetical protein